LDMRGSRVLEDFSERGSFASASSAQLITAAAEELTDCESLAGVAAPEEDALLAVEPGAADWPFAACAYEKGTDAALLLVREFVVAAMVFFHGCGGIAVLLGNAIALVVPGGSTAKTSQCRCDRLCVRRGSVLDLSVRPDSMQPQDRNSSVL
jgi:hypothetical protein